MVPTKGWLAKASTAAPRSPWAAARTLSRATRCQVALVARTTGGLPQGESVLAGGALKVRVLHACVSSSFPADGQPGVQRGLLPVDRLAARFGHSLDGVGGVGRLVEVVEI